MHHERILPKAAIIGLLASGGQAVASEVNAMPITPDQHISYITDKFDSQKAIEDLQSSCIVHTVQKGENLWQIAANAREKVEDIKRDNPKYARRAGLIHPGEEVELCPKAPILATQGAKPVKKIEQKQAPSDNGPSGYGLGLIALFAATVAYLKREKK